MGYLRQIDVIRYLQKWSQMPFELGAEDKDKHQRIRGKRLLDFLQ